MRVLRAVVLLQMTWAVTGFVAAFSHGRSVGFESIGDGALRFDTLIVQQPPQQPQSSPSVATLQHDHVHDFTFVMDGAPGPDALTADGRDHFIEMPYVDDPSSQGLWGNALIRSLAFICPVFSCARK